MSTATLQTHTYTRARGTKAGKNPNPSIVLACFGVLVVENDEKLISSTYVIIEESAFMKHNSVFTVD